MKVTLTIEYFTQWGESLVLIAQDNKYPMCWSGNNIWSVTIEKCSVKLLSDYYYVLMKDGLVMRTEWDHHSSKPASVIQDHWIDCPIQGCRFPRKHSAEIFDKPGYRGAGTAIPIFSLRSKDDFGIGDFRDLRHLVDWASATGQCLIQLLPINDTTRKGGWEDSYPYSPVSSFALHPLYIRLQDLGIEEDETFRRTQKKLNELSEIDYPKVFRAKMDYIRKAFEANGEKDIASAGFRKFCKKNQSWLKEYCVFCSKRDSLEESYYAWMQYHLDKQLSEEVSYAHKKHVCLKGDLPIGVSRDSADCFWHPNLFNLDSNAGAPPDYFSTTGQNWGFPTYNWDEMSKDDYTWWKARLRKMAEYFDAFRIDHILGFFRIWEIPVELKGGLEGHFNPAIGYTKKEILEQLLPIDGLFHEDPHKPGMFQPLIHPASENLPQCQKECFGAIYNDFFYHRNDQFWHWNASRKLPELLSATGMLACGEDLGMVPDCVPDVMEHECILSLRMRGMDCTGPWKEMSVCATSSHDMETLRMQCDSDPEPEQCGSMLMEYLESPSMLAIFPLQDWLSLDEYVRCSNRKTERINEPSNPNHHWRYRVHFPLEELLEEKCHVLNSTISGMIKDSQRNLTL